MKLLALIVFVLCLIIALPICGIMALNNLFGLKIEVTMYTWASALFLMALIGGGSHRS